MALFRDTDDFATVYPALKSAEWEMLLPSVEMVELNTLREQVLGPTLYDALLVAYNASIATPTPTPLTTNWARLVNKCRPVVAFLAAYESGPLLNTSTSSGGEVVAETERTKRAPMWAVNQKRAAALKHGYGYLDQLILTLIEYSATYPTWATSPCSRETRESLIPSASLANRFVRMESPWLLHQLRPAMREIQTGPVLALLGQTAYDALLAAVVAGTTDADQNKVLEHARPAILYGALADQIVPRSLNMNENGVWTFKMTSSGSGVSGGEDPASPERMDGLVRHYAQKSRQYLEALRALVVPEPPPSHRRVNGDGGIMNFG